MEVRGRGVEGTKCTPGVLEAAAAAAACWWWWWWLWMGKAWWWVSEEDGVGGAEEEEVEEDVAASAADTSSSPPHPERVHKARMPMRSMDGVTTAECPLSSFEGVAAAGMVEEEGLETPPAAAAPALGLDSVRAPRRGPPTPAIVRAERISPRVTPPEVFVPCDRARKFAMGALGPEEAPPARRSRRKKATI